MHRGQLVAAAIAGTCTAVLAAVSVAVAPLLPQRPAAAAEAGHDDAGLQAAGDTRRWQPRSAPLVIAHRGASAYRPEHTLDAYRLAISMGADYIEADLVLSSDGQLVARHENELSATTDVALHPEFAGRRKTKRVSGTPTTGWFTEDFTLIELRTLRAVPRRDAGTGSGSTGSGVVISAPPGSRPAGTARPAGPAGSAGSAIPTLQEIIDLARQASAGRAKPVGLYLELKLPGYFAALKLAPEPLLAAILHRNKLADDSAPVFVESFEADSLRALHKLVDVPLIQLLWGAGGPADPSTRAEWLAQVHTYAAGLGIDRSRLREQASAAPSGDRRLRGFVDLVHDAGLEVHVYTFANNAVLAPVQAAAYRATDPPGLADALAEYRAYFRLGVDGVFTDNPDVAVTARS